MILNHGYLEENLIILENRQKLKAFELINNKIVVNPLFNSTKEFIEDYFLSNNLPRHPLFEQGYLSIGCSHCTVKTKILRILGREDGPIRLKQNVVFILIRGKINGLPS